MLVRKIELQRNEHYTKSNPEGTKMTVGNKSMKKRFASETSDLNTQGVKTSKRLQLYFRQGEISVICCLQSCFTKLVGVCFNAF